MLRGAQIVRRSRPHSDAFQLVNSHRTLSTFSNAFALSSNRAFSKAINILPSPSSVSHKNYSTPAFPSVAASIPLSNDPSRPLTADDKYTQNSGWAYINGLQVLVRLPIVQHQLDKMNGKSTAGYIAGYRGSPLSTYDQQLWNAKHLLKEHHITFHPSVNEELAATACWGTQQAALWGENKYDGVFSIWYGKGPGVDRTGDAFRHANRAGTAPFGGVLALLGDDHSSEASTIASASEYAMVDVMIPILNPANVQELLDYGLYGWALSRYAGCWVGLKTIHDTVESSASIDVNITRTMPVIPTDHELPPGGLNIRVPDTFLAVEARMFPKMDAAKAFCRANKLDKTIFGGVGKNCRIGIVTSGKAYLDVRQALDDLGVDEQKAAEIGLGVYKVAMSWPLEPTNILQFCEGLSAIIVVEEKRSLIEWQLKSLLYGKPNAPSIVGKFDEQGKKLLPEEGQLQPTHVAVVIGQRIVKGITDAALNERVAELEKRWAASQLVPPPLRRLPTFCPGCPHNMSTTVPEGSKGISGIGCHTISMWMPDGAHRTGLKMTHMGVEGAGWVGESSFSKRPHSFQNMGDGTYFHSGILSIRHAVGTNTSMTFKILYNHGVAMTGGQAVDGPMSVQQLAAQVAAEAVVRIAVVTVDPSKYKKSEFPSNCDIRAREELDTVQRELREIKGTTVLIYDQTCATEARRKRKKGLMPDHPERVFINPAVCDGCGDCSAKSFCVALTPSETPLGRKRQIDQSACNQDVNCLRGFCPSFVTVQNATPRKTVSGIDYAEILKSIPPPPSDKTLMRPYNIVMAGVGGTGVLTVAAIICMAAHLEGKGSSTLDMSGLAQKGGTVLSHVRLAPHPNDLTSTRVAAGSANLLLASDMVATQMVLGSIRENHTNVVVNTDTQMTVDFQFDPDFQMPTGLMRRRIERAAGGDKSGMVTPLPVTRLAMAAVGDAVPGNMLLVGFALQKGWIPVSVGAMERAIKMNGVNVETSTRAFHWGRAIAHNPALVDNLLNENSDQFNFLKKLDEETSRQPLPAPEVEKLIAHFVKHLSEYKDAAYATTFQKLVDRARAAETEKAKGCVGLVEAVAKGYAQLLAVKDEYEVARLFTDPAFTTELNRQFEGNPTINYHFAPPLLLPFLTDKRTGAPRKMRFGPWFGSGLKWLASMRGVRDTAWDPFRNTKDRKLARTLRNNYEQTIEEVLKGLNADNHELAVRLAKLPTQIRGFGPVKEKNATKTEGIRVSLLAEFQGKAK